MPAFPTAQPFCGGYFSQLIGSARVRYKEKIELCENVDPYTLRLGTDTSADASLLPSVAHGDIVTYLVFSTSFVTLDQMKAYKALESHNYFTSGWVKSLSAKRLGEDKVLLLGEVSAEIFCYFHVSLNWFYIVSKHPPRCLAGYDARLLSPRARDQFCRRNSGKRLCDISAR